MGASPRLRRLRRKFGIGRPAAPPPAAKIRNRPSRGSAACCAVSLGLTARVLHVPLSRLCRRAA